MIELSEEETKIIERIRNLEWGKIVVAVKDGEPVMLSKFFPDEYCFVREDIKLDKNA